jgi:hypothetical protein
MFSQTGQICQSEHRAIEPRFYVCDIRDLTMSDGSATTTARTKSFK